MPYRSTGRPVGRPKRDLPKRYTSISLKMPLDLFAHAKAYGARHRQSLSTLLKDGLAMRLDDDPRWPALQPAAQDDGEEIQKIPVITSMPPLADVQAIVTLIDAAIQRWRPLLQAPGGTSGVPPDSSPTPHALHVFPEIPRQAAPHPGEAREAAQGKDQVQDLAEATGEAQARTACTFDPEKFHLGKLCPRGHEYQDTGQSLLRKHNKCCPECENQLKRARRARRTVAARQEGER